MSVLLLDIEGTVCPISFVKDVLFPYFLEKLPSVLASQSFPLKDNDDPITQILKKLPEDINTPEAVVSYLTNLVKQDIKDPTLKSLQGFIWTLGYSSGELKAPVYLDAVKYIREYKGKVYIYSSGSIKAQKLLFGHVEDATGESVDLNSYLSGYFDITTSGFKYETSSYKSILEAIGVPAKEVLFLSDNVAEVKAAIGAGMNSYIVERPGNSPLTKEDTETYRVIKSLAEL